MKTKINKIRSILDGASEIRIRCFVPVSEEMCLSFEDKLGLLHTVMNIRLFCGDLGVLNDMLCEGIPYFIDRFIDKEFYVFHFEGGLVVPIPLKKLYGL